MGKKAFKTEPGKEVSEAKRMGAFPLSTLSLSHAWELSPSPRPLNIQLTLPALSSSRKAAWHLSCGSGYCRPSPWHPRLVPNGSRSSRANGVTVTLSKAWIAHVYSKRLNIFFGACQKQAFESRTWWPKWREFTRGMSPPGLRVGSYPLMPFHPLEPARR